jgi:hypothetical protein
MSATVHRRDHDRARITRHLLRDAWVCVAALPLGLLLGTLIGDGIAGTLGHDSVIGGSAPFGVVLVAGLPAFVVMATPAALAVWFGSRAVRAGDERGVIPTVVGTLAGVGMVLVPLVAVVVGR